MEQEKRRSYPSPQLLFVPQAPDEASSYNLVQALFKPPQHFASHNPLQVLGNSCSTVYASYIPVSPLCYFSYTAICSLCQGWKQGWCELLHQLSSPPFEKQPQARIFLKPFPLCLQIQFISKLAILNTNPSHFISRKRSLALIMYRSHFSPTVC